MAIEVVEYVRRVILKNKVRQFAIRELQQEFSIESFQAKTIYYAVVNGCNSATVTKLCRSDIAYAMQWAEARESLNLIKGL